MYIAPGQGQKPPGDKDLMSTETSVTSVICCKFQKMSLKSDLYNFFRDFIHVYSAGAGADSTQWTQFGCQQKGLITLLIC